MDGRRFDSFAKAVALRRVTRRGVLGTIATGLGALVARETLGEPPTPPAAPPGSNQVPAGQVGTPEPFGEPRACKTDADCGGFPWECLGTGHGSFCFDTLSDATRCGPKHVNCSDAGEACCNGKCTDLKNDPRTCGDCWKRCKPEEYCCDGECANIDTNAKHCGSCGSPCGLSPSGKPLSCCGGVCKDLKADPKNCGGCNITCDTSETCCNGACVILKSDIDNCSACGILCYRHEACCDGVCIDITTNPKHCRGCNIVCSEESPYCCPSGCTDLQSQRNCVTCGNACTGGTLCCPDGCFDLRTDPKHCGDCTWACKANETCCNGSCQDLKNAHDYCGDCKTKCAEDEVCIDGKCVKEHGSAGPPPGFDLVAACVQPSDPGLEGEWQIVRSEWTDEVDLLESLPSTLLEIFADQGDVTSGAILTLAQIDDQGQVQAVVKSAVFACTDESAAAALYAAYGDASGDGVQPLDASNLFADADGVRLALAENPADPELAALPDTPAVEVAYQEGAMVGVVWRSGNDPDAVAPLATDVIDRLETASTPGGNLASRLAYVEIDAPIQVWYSRLAGKPQRRAGVADDQWARQQETEAEAIDFARATQAIPSVEPDATYTLSTWAGRLPDESAAQAWLDAIPDRLAAQNPDAQLLAVDEAQGMGDASQSFLYTLSLPNISVIGVSLYARVGPDVFAAGLSLAATTLSPGVQSLFADARPMGKGAQTVLATQLAAATTPTGSPTTIPVAAVFSESPLPAQDPATQ